jgi:hypothetical protein
MTDDLLECLASGHDWQALDLLGVFLAHAQPERRCARCGAVTPACFVLAGGTLTHLWHKGWEGTGLRLENCRIGTND